jgi:hypothetical protein
MSVCPWAGGRAASPLQSAFVLSGLVAPSEKHSRPTSIRHIPATDSSPIHSLTWSHRLLNRRKTEVCSSLLSSELCGEDYGRSAGQAILFLWRNPVGSQVLPLNPVPSLLNSTNIYKAFTLRSFEYNFLTIRVSKVVLSLHVYRLPKWNLTRFCDFSSAHLICRTFSAFSSDTYNERRNSVLREETTWSLSLNITCLYW